jgi:hypothetical protein
VRKILGVLAGTFLLASCQGAEKKPDVAPTYTKAHDLQQLMAVVVQPQADVFWKSAGAVTDDTGEHELRPTTDEGWLRSQSAAATLVEMGNLMQTPLYAEGRGKDWMQFSQALSQISMKAEKAARDRASEDQIFEIGGTMYNVCSACHQAYPPAAGEIPAAEDAAAGDSAANETAQ